MSKLFLAAGVAALAMAAPVSGKPGGDGGGKGGHAPKAQQGGGGKHGGGGQAKMQRGGGGGKHGGGHAQMQRGGGGGKQGGKAIQMRGGGGGHQLARAPKHEQKQQRVNYARGPEKQMRAPKMRQQQRMDFAQNGKAHKLDRQQRVAKIDRKQNGKALAQMQQRGFEQRNDFARAQTRQTERMQYGNQYANRDYGRTFYGDNDTRFIASRNWADACPPGLRAKNNGCLPPGHAKFVGQPINTLARYASFGAVPLSIQYLYPDNDDYYYRYGDGYVYRVDRQNDLVSSLIPLLAGGLLPGQMFPTNYSYANSYVPSYFDSFYPDTPYVDYRYAYGNAYAVDPYTGLIQDVVPTYGYGYGVGQALPAGYGYYNVPYQYRDLYPATADTSYWYAPGAIYQVDPQTQLLTSVASLLAPGFTVGQQIPAGYNYYNVPMDYRQTYYDTPDAWYRYNNGNIYQVDPTTQLVTAIVASILT